MHRQHNWLQVKVIIYLIFITYTPCHNWLHHKLSRLGILGSIVCTCHKLAKNGHTTHAAVYYRFVKSNQRSVLSIKNDPRHEVANYVKIPILAILSIISDLPLDNLPALAWPVSKYASAVFWVIPRHQSVDNHAQHELRWYAVSCNSKVQHQRHWTQITSCSTYYTCSKYVDIISGTEIILSFSAAKWSAIKCTFISLCLT